jgi:hypothetical protein
MAKKLSLLFVVLILALSLAACSGAQQSSSPQTSGQAAQASQATPQPGGAGAPAGNPGSGQPDGNGTLPTQSKLAAGTLKLEGTNLAVTADQAKKLLPLWQQVKTLAADTKTTADQLQAVYTQIQSAMTADQVKAIESTNLSFDDMQALLTQLGVQITPGAGGPNGQAQGTPPADNGQTQPQGTPPAMKGTPQAGGQPQGNGQGAQGTPDPNGMPGPMGGGGRGMDTLLIDPLIKLLQTRSGG